MLDDFQLPLRAFGLKNIPAVPVDLEGMVDTLLKLDVRAKQTEQAIQGLSKTYTLSGRTAPAHAFLFGGEAADAKPGAARERLRGFLSGNPLEIFTSLVGKLKEEGKELVGEAVGGGDDLTALSLDDPRQWSMSWTTLPDVYGLGLPHLDEWAATVDVKQPDKATAAFWPTIARYGWPTT
jgi:hypothetical protein